MLYYFNVYSYKSELRTHACPIDLHMSCDKLSLKILMALFRQIKKFIRAKFWGSSFLYQLARL